MMMLTFVLFQSFTYIKALTRQWRLIDGKRETEIRSGIEVLEGSAEQQVCSQSERWVQIRNGLIFLSKTADRMADVNWPQHFKAFCLRILHYRGQICAFTINVFICCVNSRLCVFPPQLWKTVAFSWWTSQTMSCGCHCLMSRCQTRVDMFASSTRIPRRRPTLTSLC